MSEMKMGTALQILQISKDSNEKLGKLYANKFNLNGKNLWNKLTKSDARKKISE